MLLLAAPPLRYRKECDSTGCLLGQPQFFFNRPPRKEFFTEYNSFTQVKEKILSLTQALHTYMYARTYVCI